MTRVVAVVAAVATLAIALRVVDPSNAANWPIVGAFIVWAISPYWYLYRQSGKGAMRPARQKAVLALSLVAGAFGVWVYYDGVIANPDAQGLLLMLFLPLWQWLGLGAAMFLVNRLTRA